MENAKDKIIKKIASMSGRYSGYEIFNDWIRCMALSISNSLDMLHGELWEQREAEYKSTLKKYNPDEQANLCEMTAWLTEALEESIEDVLGYIFMKSGMGSASTGQFFTPFHLSELTASTAMQDLINSYDGSVVSMREPSCGGGGMVIAAAKLMKEAGIDYQKVLDVVAQDLDWKGVYMCYVQLSLLGIKATCLQGDSLGTKRPEPSQIFYTPARAGMML